ncbi:MAG: hypothetical protein K6F24_00965 [Atopobiaceae bacterium]|nr:hypothetical protein [Atopobiaceae bacterium]
MADITILAASLAALFRQYQLGAFPAALTAPAVPAARTAPAVQQEKRTGVQAVRREVLLVNDKTFFSYGMDTPGNVVC